MTGFFGRQVRAALESGRAHGAQIARIVADGRPDRLPPPEKPEFDAVPGGLVLTELRRPRGTRNPRLADWIAFYRKAAAALGCGTMSEAAARTVLALPGATYRAVSFQVNDPSHCSVVLERFELPRPEAPPTDAFVA